VRKGSAVFMQNRILYGLIFLAMFMSLGHHIDHVFRGNQVGWPLTAEVNAFTYSLGVYPLILLGLYLYSSGRVGLLGSPIGFGRSLRGSDSLRSCCCGAPGRHHQPLRSADHRLAGVFVAGSLCDGARGDVPLRDTFVVSPAQ
jgi:hypothetical protein